MSKKKYILIFIVIAALSTLVFFRGFNGGGGYVRSPKSLQTENVQAGKLEVIYTDAGFSPNSLSIKVGDTVIFKNQSSGVMWVASNPHPVHTDFSAFDARRGYKTGENYSFTFVQAGTFGYHNHLSPSKAGIIIAQ